MGFKKCRQCSDLNFDDAEKCHCCGASSTEFVVFNDSNPDIPNISTPTTDATALACRELEEMKVFVAKNGKYDGISLVAVASDVLLNELTRRIENLKKENTNG